MKAKMKIFKRNWRKSKDIPSIEYFRKIIGKPAKKKKKIRVRKSHRQSPTRVTKQTITKTYKTPQNWGKYLTCK